MSDEQLERIKAAIERSMIIYGTADVEFHYDPLDPGMIMVTVHEPTFQ